MDGARMAKLKLKLINFDENDYLDFLSVYLK